MKPHVRPLHHSTELVEAFEDFLAKAKEGKIGACYVIYLDATEHGKVELMNYIPDNSNYYYLLGAIEDAKTLLWYWWNTK